MNRKEFMAQLSRLLYDIPAQEREEALEYYNGYFDDAGEENESSVIQELGSPGKVAAIIKADLEGNTSDYGEFTENGYTDSRFDRREMPESPGRQGDRKKENHSGEENREEGWKESRESGNRYNGPYSRYGSGSYSPKRNRNGVMWVLIIVLAVITCPVWGGILVGILGAVLGILVGALGIIAAVLLCGLGLFGGGIAMVIYAVWKMLATPAAAIAYAGAGMVMTAIGILLIVAFLWIGAKVLPALFRFFIDLIQRIFHRGIRGGNSI